MERLPSNNSERYGAFARGAVSQAELSLIREACSAAS